MRFRLRRLVVPLVVVLAVVLGAAVALGVGYSRRSFPQTTGEIDVAGLSAPVDVLRDERGVAHIYADTPEDLFLAQGYVAAQDRFFQMDLRRHVTAGRLAELVGPGGLETDKVIRTMGWRRVAEQELSLLAPQTRRYLQSYAAGVNAYLEANSSPSAVSLEYVVLSLSVPDYRIEQWDEVDSLAWLKAMAWDLRGNYTDELARGRLAGRLPLNQLNSLYPDAPIDRYAPILSDEEWDPPAATPLAPDSGRADDPAPFREEPEGPAPAGPRHLGPDRDQLAASLESTEQALAAIPPLLGSGEGIGSNSWVVSGEHTASGKPLLANDPHLGVQQPGIWLQAGLHCRTVSQDCPYDVSGFTFAGFPGVIIGHNDTVAWGFTNLDPDVTDFYLEDVSDEQVRRGEGWEPLQTREETIKVAGADDVTITVRATRHGPILSDVIDEVAGAGESAAINRVEESASYDVAMAWTGLQPATTADAVFALNTARTWEEFRGAAQLFAVPSQNLIYADTAGNIGYQAPGLVPLRESSTQGMPPGFDPAPGWDPTYDWTGWVDFEDLPFAYNPEDGVIVTANQAVTSGNRPFLTTEWDHGYRAQRIVDLLEQARSQGPLTVETMERIQTDTANDFAATLVPYLVDIDLPNAFYTEAVDLLRDWDLSADLDGGEQGAGATYYYAVWRNLLNLTFNDELPPDLYASGNGRWMTLVAELLERPRDPWWDDKRTPTVVETRDEILRQALIDARLELTSRLGKDTDTWQWSRIHQVKMSHEVFGGDDVPGVVKGIFNDGPYPAPGGSALVNAFSWEAGEGYAVTAAPSMRMVVDLADLDASRWVNQTGSSGHAFHPNYTDQTRAWLDGENYPWPHSRGAVDAATEQRLTLTPGE